MQFLGNLLSAGANLLGGFFGQKTQEDIANKNIAMQQEFAQNGVQWKVADAKAAGINPLAALGAPTSSFSNIVGSNPMGEGISKAGQDIGRAVQSTSTKDDQHAVIMGKLAEQKGQLENDLLASQIARINNAGANGPPTPAASQRYGRGLHGQQIDAVDTQTTSPVVKYEPAKVAPAVPGRPDISVGENPGTQFIAQGEYLYPSMSDTLAKATSNDTLANMWWRLKNEAGFGDKPPGGAAPGYEWVYTPGFGWKQDRVDRFGTWAWAKKHWAPNYDY